MGFIISIAPILIYALYHYTQKYEFKKYGYIIITGLAACLFSGLLLLGLNHKTFSIIRSGFDFVSLTGLSNNFYLYVYSILQLFGATFFGLKVGHFQTVVTCLRFVLLASVFYFLYKLYKQWQKLNYNIDPITEILAIGAILNSLAFIFSTQPTAQASARYMSAFCVFGVIIVARNLSKLKWFFTVSLIALLIFVSSGIEFVKYAHETSPTPYAQVNLTQFLKQNNLTYGYGTYWNSNIITVESEGAVTVRDVFIQDGIILPYNWLTNSSWYKTGKNPASHFYIYTTLDPSYDYYTAAVNTFGVPNKILHADAYTVLVWKYDLSTRLPPHITK